MKHNQIDWAVGTFLQQNRFVRFNEDDFLYSRGLYRAKHCEWLDSVMRPFLKSFGYVPSVTDVQSVTKLVRVEGYQDDGIQPPFWLSSRKPADVIVTANGILKIADDGTSSFGPHDPDLFAVCGVPFDYDPQAACPSWLEFVAWLVGGNKDEARLLQQFCAWPLVARRLKLEKLLWLYGVGENGKSTFLRLVRYVLGEDSTSAVGLDAFSGSANFKMWPTLYKIANFTMDAEVDTKRSTAALNAFVSNDPVTLNRKYQRQLTVEPYAVEFVGANEAPILRDPSDAFWRRILPVACEQKPTKPDPGLITRLKAEASGILNWLLAALPDLLVKQAFDMPESVRGHIEFCRSQVNAARQFIQEKVAPGKADDFIIRDDFMGMFGEWCNRNWLKPDELAVVQKEMLRVFGVTENRRRKGVSGRRERGWSGVAWKPEEDDIANYLQREEHAADLQELQENNTRLLMWRNELVDKQNKLVERLEEREEEVRRLKAANARLELRLLDAKARFAKWVNRATPACHGGDDGVEDLETILSQLEDDDVSDDGKEGGPKETGSDPGLPAGQAATGCGAGGVGEDNPALAGVGEVAGAGGGDASATAMAAV